MVALCVVLNMQMHMNLVEAFEGAVEVFEGVVETFKGVVESI